MRRKDKEITDPEIIRSILQEAEICRLGLVDNNEAYIVPVNFAYHDQNIYIHTARNGRKMELMKANPKISFEVEAHASIVSGPNPCDWTARYRSIMGRGIAIIDENTENKKTALDLIMKKYGWNYGELMYDESLLSRMCVVVIKIHAITGKQSGTWE
jgi:nitroimidazol reductase NimA-like FMN-containing flavoprotein (pyridoxamine 5'-phosphate oxidase superfamily)